jgi:predicted O-methyltransferase YrrM
MDSSYVLLEGCRPSKTLEFLATPPQIRKYLELGVYCGDTFMKVLRSVDYAVGVDVSLDAFKAGKEGFFQSTTWRDRARLYEGSTDDFFKQNDDTFDLIFIDASHEYEQVKIDLTNSIPILNEGGYIAMHDIDPLEEWMVDAAHCGDCNKILQYIDEHLKDYQFITIHHDLAGVGILQKKTINKFQGLVAPPFRQ